MSTNVDSGEVQVDAVASQATEGSPVVSDQPNSQTEQLDSLVTALLENKDFQEKLSQAAQSQKDRRFDKIEKKQTSQDSRLDRVVELVAEGKSPQDAKNQVDIEDMLSNYRGNDAQSDNAVSETADAGASFDVGTQLKQAGIDPTSDYGKLVAVGLGNTQYSNPTQINNAIIKEQARLAQKPTASGATTTIPSGGSSSTSADALLGELAALNAKPSADDSKRAQEIMQELKKLD